MLGERLQCAIVTERGILGDRAYALVDRLTGNVGSAKNPRKWGFLLQYNARRAAGGGGRTSSPGHDHAARRNLHRD
jgi:uncharacterized protein